MAKEWNLKQLKDRYNDELVHCYNHFERINYRAIAGREMRRRAHEIAATRPLTPGELAIAEEFGYPAP